MIKIDKNIPIPNSRRIPKYPWKGMAVGDSFLIEGKTKFCQHKMAKRHGMVITVRKENGGIRVWRVK